MQIPIEKFEAFNQWQDLQVKNRLKTAISEEDDFHKTGGASFSPITVKSKTHNTATVRTYFLKPDTGPLKQLFSATLLLDEQKNPTLIFEWPGGEKEFEAFIL